MKILVPVALVLAVSVAVPAAAQPPRVATPMAPQQCLQRDRVNGWNVVDDQTLIVSDPLGKKFKVSLAPGCRDLKWPMHLGFTAAGGLGISCVGRNDFVIVPPNGPDVSQRCLIRDVQPYTAEMQRADAMAAAAAKAH